MAEENIALETDEDRDLTPEQEAEMLGEELEPSKTPDEESADKETDTDTAKPDETVLKPKESETEPPAQFTQEQVEAMIQDRLTRNQRELQESNQQLQERLAALEKDSTSTQSEAQDLGTLFGDPKWAGWTLEALKEQGHEEHYHLALGRLGALQESTKWKSEQENRRQQEAMEKAFQEDMNAIKEVEPTYFDAVTGKPNETFKVLTDWAEKNQVFNLSLAHKLKNFDALIANAGKAAVTQYIEQASKSSLQRISEQKDAVSTKSISSMDDKALTESYVSARDAEQETAIEKEMEKRGLL